MLAIGANMISQMTCFFFLFLDLYVSSTYLCIEQEWIARSLTAGRVLRTVIMSF